MLFSAAHRWVCLFAVAGVFLARAAMSQAAESAKGSGLDKTQLYELTNVWTAHFTFSREEWREMEPTRGEGGPRRIEGAGGPNLTGPVGGRNGLSAVRGIEFNYVHAALDVAGAKFNKVAVRYKGNGTYFRSQNSLKRSLKVDLNEFLKGQNLAGATKLNFHSNVSDPTCMLEPLSYRLYRDGDVPAPRTAYCKVYLTVPGQYQKEYVGLYSMVENIDRHFVEQNFGVKGGAIFKPVGPNLFGYLGEDWADYKQQYDPKTALTPAQSKRMIDFCKLISSSTDAEFAKSISGFLQMDEFARFMAVTVCLSSMDSILAMSQNFYVYLHPKSNRFEFIPWDLDNSFGKFRMTGTQQDREDLSIRHPWIGENRFIERMFGVPEFKRLYMARLKEFSEGFTNLSASINRWMNLPRCCVRRCAWNRPGSWTFSTRRWQAKAFLPISTTAAEVRACADAADGCRVPLNRSNHSSRHARLQSRNSFQDSLKAQSSSAVLVSGSDQLEQNSLGNLS